MLRHVKTFYCLSTRQNRKEEANRYRNWSVVVDRFSKYVVFIPAPNACPTDKVAKLIFRNMVKYFRVPTDIIGDKDAWFIVKFWTVLFQLIRSELKFCTANHPQTGSQIERVNGLFEEYLRHYVTTS